jgi:aspartate kinase
LAQRASSFFDVQVEKNLHLLTIRHYSQAIIDRLIANKTVLLQQRTRETIQLLYH